MKYLLILNLIYILSCGQNKKYSDFGEIFPYGTDSTLTEIDTSIFSYNYVFDKNIFTYGQPIEVTQIQNINLFQGDIIMPTAEKTLQNIKSDFNQDADLNSVYLLDKSDDFKFKRWPSTKIYYRLHTNPATMGLKSKIELALRAWEVAKLDFVEANSPLVDHIFFTSNYDQRFSCTQVGYHSKKHDVILKSDSDVGTIIHEIGHVLGLLHEHSRPDRNKYIDINHKYVDPVFKNQILSTFEDITFTYTDYDYESIMHYGEKAYIKKNAPPSAWTIKSRQNIKIGQRNKPSVKDITKVKKLYGINF